MKALSIAATGIRRLFRDRSNYFFVFILPLGIIVILGSLFGSGFRPTIGLVAPSTGLEAFLAARLEAVTEYDVVRYETLDQLRLSVERSTVHAGVVIGPETGERLASGGDGEIGFIARPDSVGPQLQAMVTAVVSRFASDVVAARIAGGDLEAGVVAASRLAADLPPIEVRVTTTGEALFPSTVGQFDLGASSQLILFMFLTGLTGSAALIQSRQLGVSRRMLSTPTSSGTIVIGEALGRFGVVLVQGLYIVAVTLLAFGVNWGDPWGAAAIIALFGLTAAGAAMLMGSVFRNDQQAGGVGVMLGLGLAALGGAMVPVEVMPPSMQQVARVTPHAWALDAFAVLVRQDGSVVDILPQLGVLTAFAAGALLLAAWRFRTVLTRGA
jgi:ABC-2 type transport system permease protein